MAQKYRVKNWRKYQHYSDRNPPWIKLATDTFQNYEFSCLQDASKLLAICYWTLAARDDDGLVNTDLDFVKRLCGLGDSVSESNLKELIEQGFLIDASNVLAECKQDASNVLALARSRRGETETEEKKEKKKKEKKKKEISSSQEKEVKASDYPEWISVFYGDGGWAKRRSADFPQQWLQEKKGLSWVELPQ